MCSDKNWSSLMLSVASVVVEMGITRFILTVLEIRRDLEQPRRVVVKARSIISKIRIDFD
jgi:hypothetical protein